MGMQGQPMSSRGQPVSTREQAMDQGWGDGSCNAYGKIWCSCRRRCLFSELTVKPTCDIPFLQRNWNTCCKRLRYFQTSSTYSGYGDAYYHVYPQVYPVVPSYGMAKAVLPFIQSTTPGYFARMRQGVGWNNRRPIHAFWGTSGGQSRGSAYPAAFRGTRGGRSRGSPYPGSFWGTRGAQSRVSVYPEDQYRTKEGQSVESGYGASWCTCRRSCRRPEMMVVRNNCLLPSYIRSWHTCCKYLNTYQTSSPYRGFGSASVSSQRNSQRRNPIIGARIPGTTAPKGF